ncbi:Fungal specific transcription factor domain-containing protein [Cladophialophora immunda]|nr:Fungal specific transcription factor domain-containing protein [Cladophialophora immunda]
MFTIQPTKRRAARAQLAQRKRSGSQACCHCRSRKSPCICTARATSSLASVVDKVGYAPLTAGGETRTSECPQDHQHLSQSLYSPIESDIPSSHPRMSIGTKSNQQGALAETTLLPHPTAHPLPECPQWTLPPFIRRYVHDCHALDCGYLAEKGCFVVPSQAEINGLIEVYVEYIHPLLPLLDLEEWRDMVGNNPKDHPQSEPRALSLLVLQGLLFAASAYIDHSTLEKLGYTSRFKAQNTFFYRAKTLYDFDMETDPIAIIQCLLLLTYRVRTSLNQKDAFYWVRTAITHAQNVDLGGMCKRAPEGRQKKLLKRLWWCCLVREALVGLAIRQPLLLRHREHEPAFLEIDDFGLTSIDQEIDVRTTHGGDLAGKRTLATICLEMARLCVCIVQILSMQSTAAASANAGQPTVSLYETSSSTGRSRDFDDQECAARLKNWLRTLNPDARIPGRSIAPEGDATPRVVMACRIILHMTYFTAIGGLYRNQAVAPRIMRGPNRSLNMTARYAGRQVLRSAHQIALLAQRTIQDDLAGYMAPHCITSLLSSIVILRVEVRSAPSTKSEEAHSGLRHCIHLLQLMGQRFEGCQRLLDALTPIPDGWGTTGPSHGNPLDSAHYDNLDIDFGSFLDDSPLEYTGQDNKDQANAEDTFHFDIPMDESFEAFFNNPEIDAEFAALL